MVYREPWVDEQGRLLDEAEIEAFRAKLVWRRRWIALRFAALAFVVIGGVALVRSAPHKHEVVFERKAECVYDGCYCRGEDGNLVQTACAPPSMRECLPIADRCD